MEGIAQFAAVAGVLLLLAAALWWLRRRGFTGTVLAGKPTGRRLQSIERMPLGPQHTLHLVRLGERAFLVASSPGGCALLENVAWREIDNAQEAR
jgi:flagellar biosynthetic protein FliO